MRRILCALLALALPSPALAALSVQLTFPLDGAFVANDPNVTTFTVVGTLSGATGTAVVDVNGTPASVNVTNTGWSAHVTLAAQGANTLVATANDDAGTPATDSIAITYDSIKPVINFTEPNSVTTTITTDHTGVQVTGTIADASPIAVFSLRGLTVALDPNDPTNSFTQFVKVGPGTNTITSFATDKAGNTSDADVTPKFTINRTVVCDDTPNDPNFPIAGAGGPKNYSVDRVDDLPQDPNADPDTCEVRADSRPAPADPNDPHFVPPGLHHCTLRAAIQAANHHPGPDYIFLPAFHFDLSQPGAHEDAAKSGDLDVTDDVRIRGAGRDVTVIDARKTGDRVFEVAHGVKFQLFDLTVSNGRVPLPAKGADPNDSTQATPGGCLLSGGLVRANNVAFLGCSSPSFGGAIAQDEGSLLLTCSIVARGNAKKDGGGIVSEKGALLDVENSTVSLNTAGQSGGGIAHHGGVLVLKNDTLSGNGAKVQGGAVAVSESDALVNNCTFSSNKSKAGSTISMVLSSGVTIANSILGDTSKLECDPNSPEPITSGGGNVERGDSCQMSAMTGDLVNTDPQLQKLATNSATAVLPPTQKLSITSPALDFAGVRTPCTALDARANDERSDWPGNGTGDGSPGSDATPPFCDSGAFELIAPH
jgi:hypothetical protein